MKKWIVTMEYFEGPRKNTIVVWADTEQEAIRRALHFWQYTDEVRFLCKSLTAVEEV